MPIYEYRCENGHTFEVFQNMSDDPVTACEECGAPVQRVYHPVAVHYKGSGFYATDYAGRSKTASSDGASSDEGGGSEAKGDSGGESKSDSGGEPKSDSKGSKDSKAGSKTASKD